MRKRLVSKAGNHTHSRAVIRVMMLLAGDVAVVLIEPFWGFS